jgi:hypothetical protein
MLNAGEIVPEFMYRGKRNVRNMVIEVGLPNTTENTQHEAENRMAHTQSKRL